MTTDTRTQHTPKGIERPLSVGVYDATDTFRAIERHACVCFADDLGLVATVGRAEDQDAQRWADLFAAAPDLLAALEAAATRITRSERYGCMCGETGVQTPCGHCVWTQARAAIAKAKGQ